MRTPRGSHSIFIIMLRVFYKNQDNCIRQAKAGYGERDKQRLMAFDILVLPEVIIAQTHQL